MSIAASLSAQGISPTAPGQLTVDEPVYQGAVMYSGWTDDPVSTGTGHFLERDQDLAMPDALAVLGWTRTYSSRFVADQCNGRGWHTWADVRLDVQAAIVTYHGPDGQVSPFARAGDDWVRHPAMEAELRDAEGGFELAWRWTARFPGLRWKFDEGGGLQRMVDPFGGETAVERDGDRLVALVHDGGRRLDVVWSNGLVSELVSSDGRRVFFQMTRAAHGCGPPGRGDPLPVRRGRPAARRHRRRRRAVGPQRVRLRRPGRRPDVAPRSGSPLAVRGAVDGDRHRRRQRPRDPVPP